MLSKSFTFLKQYTVRLLFIVILGGCGSSNQQASTDNTNNNDALVDDAAIGNGVWDYSVATDYYYGTQDPVESPSLMYDLRITYPTTATVIQFVFPVFATLDSQSGTISNPVESSDFVKLCPPHETPSATQMLNYYALPQLKDSYLNTGSVLGTCVDGESVTKYYASFISNVVPVIEITQNLGSALASATTDEVIAVADNVANIINNDRNAYGVAFDNEPLLSKEGTSSSSSKGMVLEQTFYGEIAYKLALKKKYLFLFDANTTAAYLKTNGYNHSNLNNIIIEQYLYDLDTTESQYPAGPVSLATYSVLVESEAAKDMAPELSNNPPLRFVLPASATSTMWNYLQAYNMAATGVGYIPETTLTDPTLCESSDAITIGTVDNGALSAFLCSSSGTCPGTAGVIAESIISDFLSVQNCVNYTNSNSMPEYFGASLSSVVDAKSFTNNRYLGADLYAWRISAYSDINASKGYYNQNFSSHYESSTQLFPANILPSIWESFMDWSTNH